MRKVFCDCCEKEITVMGTFTFSYYCHLDKEFRFKCGYGDKDHNSVSGRSIGKELCAKCYNEIVIVSVEKFESLRKEIEEKNEKPISNFVSDVCCSECCRVQ